ncbi:MAG: bifunctional phosphoserine phosphatase/homoserine phosphotransferase ThrH [Dehalococcoidia bacterium]
MKIACLDLEGILIPEIWIAFAEYTSIDSLRLTTRDVPDYDELMQRRLGILKENNLVLRDIQNVISRMQPLEGAGQFLDWLRERFQVVLITDSFYEFVMPFMRQMGYPIVLCHNLQVDDDGFVTGYVLRKRDWKRQVVKAFHDLNYRVISCGDSYNDVTMLKESDAGILFRPPGNVAAEFPQYIITQDYHELREAFLDASNSV